jgi:hypothetical protein
MTGSKLGLSVLFPMTLFMHWKKLEDKKEGQNVR